MNLRTILEARILYIFLTFKTEMIDEKNSLNSFDIIQKHNLLSEDFKDINHQWIFKAIQNQHQFGLPSVDIVRIVEFRPKDFRAFPQQKIEFMNMVKNLLSSNYSPFSEIEKLINQLKSFVIEDFLNEISHKILQKSFDSNESLDFGDQLFQEYEKLKTRITSGLSDDFNTSKAEDLLLKRINANVSGIFPGVIVRHLELKEFLQGGWMAPDLIVIGARPSMGKTAFALACIRESMHDNYLAFFTLEVQPSQIWDKLVAAEHRIEYKNLKTGNVNPDFYPELKKTYQRLQNKKLKVYGSNEASFLEQIQNKSRRLKKLGELDMIIIDYLQLVKIQDKKSSRQEVVSEISRELKLLANELNVPVLALSQLKRPQDNRDVKRPNLTDLRESGAIEQDADIVGFLHRPAYYRESGLALDYEIEFETELIFQKGRDLGTNFIKFFNDVKLLLLR